MEELEKILDEFFEYNEKDYVYRNGKYHYEPEDIDYEIDFTFEPEMLSDEEIEEFDNDYHNDCIYMQYSLEYSLLRLNVKLLCGDDIWEYYEDGCYEYNEEDCDFEYTDEDYNYYKYNRFEYFLKFKKELEKEYKIK